MTLVVEDPAEFISILRLDGDGVGGFGDTCINGADYTVVNEVIVEVGGRKDNRSSGGFDLGVEGFKIFFIYDV